MLSLRYRRSPAKRDPVPLYYDHNESDEKETKSKKSGSCFTIGVSPLLRGEYLPLIVLITVALFVRFWNIHVPGNIISNEIEVCKQINWYLHRKFFIGAYPPLAGLFYTTISWFLGYDGTDEIYYAGQEPHHLPLTQLRIVSAAVGSLIVPAVYLIIRKLGHSQLTAILGSGLLVVENGLVTQSRFIAPEGLLCALSSFAILSWVMHMKVQERDRTSIPWIYQSVTGGLIGLALSVKWQGAFLLLAVWFSTAMYIHKILGEKQIPISSVFKQSVARFVTTLLFPVCIYVAIFQLHFRLVPNAGDHDLAISSPLRYSLKGNTFEPTQQDIAYGSLVVLRHLGTNGGYLHSHMKRYTSGSTQQQVTLYPYEDPNNLWIIHKAGKITNSSDPLEYVKNNDQIMLEHYPTTRKLHSHDHRPPISNQKEQHEVTAYGDELVKDPHDYWWIRVLDEDGKSDLDDTSPVKAISSKFMLTHIRGCMLLSHNVMLPEEEHPQQEVTCMISGKKALSTWIIESAYHSELENKETTSYSPLGGFDMMIEVHKHMLGYQGVIHDRLESSPAPDPYYNYQLARRMQPSPMTWFLGQRSLRLWDQLSGRAIYVLLNPVARSIMLSAVGICLTYIGLDAMFKKRQMKWPRFLSWNSHAAVWTGYDPIERKALYYQSVSFFSATAIIHFVTLYITPTHNIQMLDILPSTCFGAGLSSVVLEAITFRLQRRWRLLTCVLVLTLATLSFWQLHDISYGTRPWPKSTCERRSCFLDLDCNRFPVQVTPLGEQSLYAARSTPTMAMSYIDLPGRVQAFRYVLGEEAKADQEIAKLQRAAFNKASLEAVGTARYHRIESTPAPTEDEVQLWREKVQEGALYRAKLKAEEEQEEAAREDSE